MAHFLPSCCKLGEIYECRGTILIDEREIVPVDETFERALAQCRDVKLRRSQKIVQVQEFDNG